jgi:ABC-type Fe3+/spermidine/putrescine transport system ATPase subunit
VGSGGIELRVENVTHRYGTISALHDVSLKVKPGDFVTLLGPSGCGKTTLLRIIAGFIRPTSGRILLNDQDVTSLPPHKRPVNTVFQRSTLFPHLNVFENVAFGLRLAKTPKNDIARRVSDALALVRLVGFEARRSHELSGGQVQRVALARVLVGKPRVLLLDEPLSALDLAIRLEMEEELRRLHREVGATFVYVTHDQREALAISDHIALFNNGHIEQFGTPSEIYRTPSSPFAARFVGDANVIPVEIAEEADGRVSMGIGDHRLVLPASSGAKAGPAWLVLRPEIIRISDPLGSIGCALDGIVRDFAYRGSGHAYRVAVPGLTEPLKVEVAAAGVTPFAVGSAISVSWSASSALLLPRKP